MHSFWQVDLSCDVGNSPVLFPAPIVVRGHGGATDGLEEPFGAHRLGAGNRCAEQPVEDELGTHSKRPRNAEEDRVVVELGQAKQVEQ